MYFSRSKLAGTALSLALLAPLAAHATPVSQATIFGANQGFRGPVSVATETDSAAPGTASVVLDGSSATQNADGTSTVAAVVPEFGSGADRVTSIAAFTQMITNETAIGREYVLSYALSNLSTQIRTTATYGSVDANPFTSDPGELFGSLYTAASFEYEVMVNGNVVFDARADVLGRVAYDSATQVTSQEYRFENVEGFDPSISLSQGTPTSDWRDQTYEFAVADIFGDIDLGPLAAGESFEVTSTLTARAFASRGEGENSVGGFGQDPVQVSSLAITSSDGGTGNPAVVPLPASGLLLLAALGGAMALRRRS